MGAPKNGTFWQLGDFLHEFAVELMPWPPQAERPSVVRFPGGWPLRFVRYRLARTDDPAGEYLPVPGLDSESEWSADSFEVQLPPGKVFLHFQVDEPTDRAWSGWVMHTLGGWELNVAEQYAEEEPNKAIDDLPF